MTKQWAEDSWNQGKMPHFISFISFSGCKSATGLSKVKQKCYFIYALSISQPSPLLLFCLLSLGSQAAVPQKADMLRLKGVGAIGKDRQLRGHETEPALNTCGSSPPSQPSPSARLTFRDNKRVWWENTMREKSQLFIWKMKGVAKAILEFRYIDNYGNWNDLELKFSFLFFCVL